MISSTEYSRIEPTSFAIAQTRQGHEAVMSIGGEKPGFSTQIKVRTPQHLFSKEKKLEHIMDAPTVGLLDCAMVLESQTSFSMRCIVDCYAKDLEGRIR